MFILMNTVFMGPTSFISDGHDCMKVKRIFVASDGIPVLIHTSSLNQML